MIMISSISGWHKVSVSDLVHKVFLCNTIKNVVILHKALFAICQVKPHWLSHTKGWPWLPFSQSLVWPCKKSNLQPPSPTTSTIRPAEREQRSRFCSAFTSRLEIDTATAKIFRNKEPCCKSNSCDGRIEWPRKRAWNETSEMSLNGRTDGGRRKWWMMSAAARTSDREQGGAPRTSLRWSAAGIPPPNYFTQVSG